MRNFRAHRFKLDWSIIATGKSSAPAAGHVTDIGLTGLRFISAKQFKMRDLLTIEITDHRKVQINTTARVVWKRTLENGEFIYGLTFEVMPFADLPILQQALSELLENQILEQSHNFKFDKHDGSRPWINDEQSDQIAA